MKEDKFLIEYHDLAIVNLKSILAIESNDTNIRNADDFFKWLLEVYPDSSKIKSIYLGCTSFVRDCRQKALLSSSKSQKKDFKYYVEMGVVFQEQALGFVNCVK